MITKHANSEVWIKALKHCLRLLQQQSEFQLTHQFRFDIFAKKVYFWIICFFPLSGHQTAKFLLNHFESWSRFKCVLTACDKSWSCPSWWKKKKDERDQLLHFFPPLEIEIKNSNWSQRELGPRFPPKIDFFLLFERKAAAAVPCRCRCRGWPGGSAGWLAGAGGRRASWTAEKKKRPPVSVPRVRSLNNWRLRNLSNRSLNTCSRIFNVQKNPDQLAAFIWSHLNGPS